MNGRTKKRYSVLHFLNSGGVGGLEKSTYQLLEALSSDNEFEVGVALAQNDGVYAGKMRDLNISVIDLKLRKGYSARLDREVIRSIKDFDIHHFHILKPNVVALSILSGRRRVRVLTRRGGEHDYMKDYGLKIRVKYVLNRFLIKRYFSGYSGNTAHAADFIVRFLGLKYAKTHVLYNGIDFGQLKPSIGKQEALRRFGLDASEFRVGTACHLVGLKRVDMLIRAFSRCDVSGKRLVIFGKGERSDSLKALAKELGVAGQVTFAGEVHPMGDYLQALDCFVLPTGREESFGNAVVEAMYLRIPSIVMADSPGLLEHVTHGKTGFVAKDESDLADQMVFIHGNPTHARAVGDAASDFVSERYSIQTMVGSYKAFYKEVMAQR